MNASNACVLGIDAGNTKTVALVVDGTGKVLSWGRGGQCNIYVSVPDALAALDKAVEQALSSVPGASLHAVTLSAAGADWPEDFSLLNEELRQRFPRPHQKVEVINDAVGVLYAGAPPGAAVAVACGTSAGIAARNHNGKVWHSSYWQEPEGAEELGQRTLRAVYRADLGIDPPTLLTSRVLSRYALESPEALLHAFTGRGRTPPERVGGLARVLLDAAAEGDATASRIVHSHGSALGDYALAAARRADIDGAFTVITAGGVMRHASQLMQRALMARIQQFAPTASWLESPFEPVVGAALHALGALGPVNLADLRGMLQTTMPDARAFET